jgi:phenylalanyl-tRNA synthetase beta chain
MIISLNWLKKYVDINIPTDELVELIGARLVEVESVTDISEKYRGIKVVEVRVCNKIEGSDHLRVCQIWDGQNEVQVVCGAPNVRVGMLAVWLPPKTVLPETWNEEPLVLEKRKLMGVESNGMLASLRELGLGDEHDGIVEISGTDQHPLIGSGKKFFGNTSGQEIKPGASFTKLFELDDTLLDIENKSLTHRPDCFGVIGFAREIAGILGQKFETPRTLESTEVETSNDVTLKVVIDDPNLCPRYEGAVLNNIDDSAMLSGHVKTYLARSGMRLINATVDITNFLMLETGQPLHAFDYDKLCQISPSSRPEILVRAAKSGEKLVLLDGKEIELAESDILICAGNQEKSVPIALAGAMGGLSTAIDNKTKNVLIESATFNLYNLRGTQFRHGIFSEAITRFTKGQPPALTDYVIRTAIKQFITFTGAKAASAIVDAYPKLVANQPIELTLDDVNDLLGTELTWLEFEKTLENIGYEIDCECGAAGKCDCEIAKVTAPWWRTDVHIKEDIIEDIGRLNGFDNITPTLPTRDFTAVEPDEMAQLKGKIRTILAAAGASEVLTYSFVHGDLLEKVGQDPKNSYKIVNAISPRLQYIRQQIVPSLLEKSYENLRANYDKFALFELNQIFRQEKGLTEEKVPQIGNNLALVLADKNQKIDFYDAKNYLVNLGEKLGVRLDFRSEKTLPKHEDFYEPKRSATVWLGKTQIGVVGEIRARVARNLKIPEHTAGFEIGLEPLLAGLPDHAAYAPISRFPSVERDMTFQVRADLSYAELENLICKNLDEEKLRFQLAPISIYQGEDETTKNISFRLTFASLEKTLTGEEITAVVDKIASAAAEQLNAKVI